MKVTYEEIAHILADKLTDSMSRDDLEQFFYEYHVNYYKKDATDFELHDTAHALGVIGENETLEIED